MNWNARKRGSEPTMQCSGGPGPGTLPAGASFVLLDEAVKKHGQLATDEIIDRLLVRFGTEILSLIPGRVSTEVDARLSFDTAATVARAERIVAFYRAEDVDTEKRVLIKIADT